MTRHDAVIVFALNYFLTLIYFHSLTRTHLLTLVYMIENHSKPDATPYPYLFSGHLIHWPHRTPFTPVAAPLPLLHSMCGRILDQLISHILHHALHGATLLTVMTTPNYILLFSAF
jgi:hypothetical protein